MFRVSGHRGLHPPVHSGYSSPEPGHVTPAGTAPSGSLLKRWNAGTHHYRVEREHLHITSTRSPSGSIAQVSSSRACSSTAACTERHTDPHPLADLISTRQSRRSSTSTTQNPCQQTLANSNSWVHLSR